MTRILGKATEECLVFCYYKLFFRVTMLKITHILSDVFRTSTEETQDFYFSLDLKLLFCKEFRNLHHGLIFAPIYIINHTFSVKDQMDGHCHGWRLCGTLSLWPLLSCASWCENIDYE